MRKLIATVALLLSVPSLVRAGNADGNSVQGQFYFFTAPIVSNTQYINVFNPPEPVTTKTKVGGNNTGFGGEVLINRGIDKGLGVGVELGYAGPDWSFDGGGAVGVGSIDASYHFFAIEAPE